LTARVEREFATRDIPYHIIGGVPFFARREIKDVLCLFEAEQKIHGSGQLEAHSDHEKEGVWNC